METGMQIRRTWWISVATCIVLVAFACATTDDPLKVGELKEPTPILTAALDSPTPTVVSDSPTSAAASGNLTAEPEETAVRLSAASAAGPPKDDLIKFADWDDNRVKLTNWLAGYMIAHGVDRAVRMIETPQHDYLQPLLVNDVDIVLAASEVWAREQADTGHVLVLGSMRFGDANTVIAAHPSLEERAPEVIEFLRGYNPGPSVIEEQAAKIKGGRIAISEAVVGLGMFKNMEEMWTPWLSPDQVEAVRIEVAAGTIGLCREWEIRLGDVFRVRYCKDDPTITSGR